MKKIISIAFAVFALFVFTSCRKENMAPKALRTVTAVFENDDTRTALSTDDNKTPLWSAGDKIRVLDESAYQDITLKSEDITNDRRTIIFKTDLTGNTLYAVYPASATTMTSCTGNITFTIPAIQDGTFAGANICVAEGDEMDELVFRNATSVLEFNQTASSTEVLRVSVTAANAIAGTLTATFGNDHKATISSVTLTGKLISTTASAAAQDKYYLAIAPVETGAINFKYYTKLTESVDDKDSKTLAQNKIYELTISTTGYENSYVEIDGKKWARCNLGATTVAGSGETCFGDYYAWGETEPYYATRTWDSSNNKWIFNTWNTNRDDGYVWQSYCNGSSSFEECSPLPFDSETRILTADYDAARKALGGDWRMPTSEEFLSLCQTCGGSGSSTLAGTMWTPESDGSASTTAKGIHWCDDYNGVAGLLFIAEDNGPHLFFPAAGFSEGTSFCEVDTSVRYWSSTRTRREEDYAHYLFFYISSGYTQGGVYPQGQYFRYHGSTVRPVSD